MVEQKRINRITEQIIGCCIDVHREIGPGLLEAIYEECVCIALAEVGLSFARQGTIPVAFRGRTLDLCYRYDLMVEDSVLVELKSVEQLTGIHQAQVLTYLRLTNLPVGLLCNFNVRLFKDGLKRLINPKIPQNLRIS